VNWSDSIVHLRDFFNALENKARIVSLAGREWEHVVKEKLSWNVLNAFGREFGSLHPEIGLGCPSFLMITLRTQRTI